MNTVEVLGCVYRVLPRLSHLTFADLNRRCGDTAQINEERYKFIQNKAPGRVNIAVMCL